MLNSFLFASQLPQIKRLFNLARRVFLLSHSVEYNAECLYEHLYLSDYKSYGCQI